MAIVVQPLGFIYKVKIGDVVIHCKQLSYRVRSMLGAKFHQQKSGAEIQDTLSLLFEVLRHSIVKVEGFQNPDGSDYELKFDNDVLTEDCLDALMYVENVGDVMQMCASGFLNMKMPDKIVHPVSGEVMEGVSITKVAPNVKKKQ